MEDVQFGKCRFIRLGMALGLVLSTCTAFAADPGITSVVIQTPPAGDVSEILHITARLFTVRFSGTVHTVSARVELYEPGSKVSEILVSTGMGGRAYTWAQISVQWADCAYLRLADQGKNAELLNIKVVTNDGSSDSHSVVQKSQFDITQGSAWGETSTFAPKDRHIPIAIDMVSPKGISNDMETTLEETLQANPKARIVVYSLDLE